MDRDNLYIYTYTLSAYTPRYIYIYISIYPVLPGQYRLNPTIFLAFSHYHGNHFEKFLAHVLSWVKTYHHAEFQRNPPTGLAMMVQTFRQTNRQTDRLTDNSVFPRHATWLKTISGWVSSIPKVWSKSNRGILRNRRT